MRYRVTDKTTGINYPGANGPRRVESGETADDIPDNAIAWYLLHEYIEPATDDLSDFKPVAAEKMAAFGAALEGLTSEVSEDKES